MFTMERGDILNQQRLDAQDIGYRHNILGILTYIAAMAKGVVVQVYCLP